MRAPRYRRFLASLATAALLLTSSTGLTLANDTQQLAPLHPAPAAEGGSVDAVAGLWFVQFGSRPAVEGTARATLIRERAAFRQQARDAGVQYRERFSYQTLWNGVAVQADTGDLTALRRLPAVKAVFPVVAVDVPETDTISPDLATALAMTGADVAQNELGLTGTGVRVAVMDTGIDYDHPDLGGCFGAGCRVETGWDFVGDDFNADATAPAYNPVPAPDPDPDDCQGHGTHVAGIVGASGDPAADGARGVAPGVTFGAYRVFGCDGSTTADIMAAAMERALADGMDVLNMSIGSAFQWPQYPTAVASDNLVDAGMVVVASIGNSGANGLYSTGAPGNGDKVIGVASFDNTHINALTFIVNPSQEQFPYLPLATTPDPPTEGTSAEVAYIGRGCTSLGDMPLEDPTGKVALLVRGDCTFQEKYQGAADAGAVGVVIHNNVAGLFAGGGVTPRDDIFGIGISDTAGLHIRAQLDAGETVTLTWTDERVNAPNPTGGTISSFSSYGMAPDLSLKPDIGAPGGLIRSTYPLEQGGYAIISGTSMASPHVAGAAALVLEARPGTTSQQMRGLLQNSADPAPWWGNPGLGFLDNVHRQGAGMLDVPGSVLSTTNVSPSKLALGESEAGPATRTLTIHNAGTVQATYDLSHEPALSTGPNTFTPGFLTGFADVAFSVASVTVAPGGSAAVDVTITANAGLPDFSQYGGYLVISQSSPAGESTYRVPYAGFKGDYQGIAALTDGGGVGFPLLAALVECDRFVELSCTMGAVYDDDLGDDPVFDLTDGFNRPYALIHLDHQVRKLQLVVRKPSGALAHPRFNVAVDVDYHGRSSTPTSFFAYAWDGTVTHGGTGKMKPVKDGTYVLEIRVLKALGDAGNPAHWESWTSPTFTIDRP